MAVCVLAHFLVPAGATYSVKGRVSSPKVQETQVESIKARKQPSSNSKSETVVEWEVQAARMAVVMMKSRRQAHHMHEDYHLFE